MNHFNNTKLGMPLLLRRYNHPTVPWISCSCISRLVWLHTYKALEVCTDPHATCVLIPPFLLLFSFFLLLPLFYLYQLCIYRHVVALEMCQIQFMSSSGNSLPLVSFLTLQLVRRLPCCSRPSVTFIAVTTAYAST